MSGRVPARPPVYISVQNRPPALNRYYVIHFAHDDDFDIFVLVRWRIGITVDSTRDFALNLRISESRVDSVSECWYEKTQISD